MAYTEYASYVIFFHDRAEYEFAVAATGGTTNTGGQFAGSPQAAATFFGIPFPFPTGNMDTIPKGVYYMAPYFPPYQPYGPSNPTGVFLTDGVASVLVPALASSYGPVGSSWTLEWRGVIVYMQGAQQTQPAPTPIPRRRWIGGLEIEPLGEGGTGIITATGCRDASRTLDGIGIALRGQNSPGVWNRTVADFQAGFTTNRSWERFYVRLRVLPSINCGIWRCHGSPSNNAGSGIRITTTGAIQLVNIDAIDTITVISTGQVLVINRWYKIDCILKYDNSGGGNNGLITVFLNGIQIFNSIGLNMNANNLHTNSDLGKWTAGVDNTVELDLDDWICADWPENLGVLTLDSPDWLMGSHVRRGITLSGSAINYTPAAPQIFNQGRNPDQQIDSNLVSTTSGALLEGLLNLPLLGKQDKAGEVALGAVGAIIAVHSSNVGGTDGQLGYNVAGAGNVMATINELASVQWNSVAFRPSGLTLPIEVTPFLIRYTKSIDANSATIRMLEAVIEYIGVWGLEDTNDPDLFPVNLPRLNNHHNCNYSNSFWGYMGPAPEALVFAIGGTYVGNGTEQHINLPYPCNMLFIRGLSGATAGIKWFAAGLGGHDSTTEAIRPGLRVWMDNAGQVKFTVTGTYAEWNASGITFQYIAFCDPGMRFSCADAFNVSNVITSRAHALQNPNFLPTFGFIQREILGSNSSVQGLSVKGPGNLSNNGNVMDSGTIIANWGNFSTGFLTTLIDTHFLNASQTNYMVFRSTEPSCGWTMLQILSYIGNGTASRNITLTPTSSRFPLFVLVCPTSGAQAPIFRDPSHAGVNSARFDSLANTVTGITAGAIDQITVGISLNAIDVTYNVFCIPGSTASWLNGTFFPPNCETPNAFYEPTLVPPQIAVMGNGGFSFDGLVPLTLLKDVTGIYVLQPGKTNDTLYDRQTGQTSVNRTILPKAKTGYIGG